MPSGFRFALKAPQTITHFKRLQGAEEPTAHLLETAAALTIDRLLGPGIIDATRLVQLLSVNPARVLGLPGGSLAPGQPADITVLDLQKKKAVDPGRFATKGRNTPFTGWALKGWPVMTVVAGNVVFTELS